MSAYDYDAPPREHGRRYYDDRRERVDPRYTETQETYYRVNPASRTALVPRAREDSDLAIEEVRRDFPPPGYAARDIRRARSVEHGYDDDYYREPRRSYDAPSSRDPRRSKKAASVYYEEEERTRKRVLSKQEKIIAAVAGGIIAAGAKEVWDRREAEKEGYEVHRNIAGTAALGAAGAFAGYQGADIYNKHAIKEDKKSTYIVHKGRDGRVNEYYSDDEEDPRHRKGNKSFLESALSAAGLGGAIKALTGGGSDRDDRHDSRSRRGSPDSHRSRDNPSARMQKAAKASLVAGAAEAFRVAREPGGWQGEKMKRVITAAAGAAAIDAAHDPSKDSKRHLVESVIGGLVGNRVLNGTKKDIEEDYRTGRSRSRSRARSGSRGGGGSGLAALATAGLGALGAKKLVEARSRSRSRRRSYDSYDSRDPSPRRRRSRSRSIVDGARRSLAKIGLGSGPDDRREDDYDDRSPRRARGRSPDDRYDDDYAARGYMRGGKSPEDDGYYDDDRSAGGRSRSRSRGGRSSSVSSSDLGDSDEDTKKTGKMRRKQLITAGLAAAATVHAAHGVYSSMNAREARHKAVAEGKLSPQEARKLKTKAILQDAASVGVAALGIQGAVSELKEARAQAKEVREWKEEKQRRHERRIERLKRANSDHYGRSRADNWNSSASPQANRYDDGPTRYTDGNPYSAALPAPPMGYDRRRD
ncbi:Uu.00g015650.m01.CDS01 [Anthostomella pinea]|uniref:Uu.00g015650.m01.CDS01 n=1 Tax=Anthostomella pinea TaxID=933095 RepID=A0AAI8YQI6_9PEZI|nr:Uu.00g015650.m01.CDS01 [Anthostomella pinea]